MIYQGLRAEIERPNLNAALFSPSGGGSGGGTVKSVNEILPDGNGNVQLDARNIPHGESNVGEEINVINKTTAKNSITQLVYDGDFASDDLWEPTHTELSVKNNMMTMAVTSTAGNQGAWVKIPSFVEHKYYGRLYLRASRNCNIGFSIHASSVTTDPFDRQDVNADVWTLFDGVAKQNTESFAARLTTTSSGRLQVGDTIELKKCIIIDLTDMFGSGNEPTKEECRLLFSDDYYKFNPYTYAKVGDLPSINVAKNRAQFDKQFNAIAYSGLDVMSLRINSKEHFDYISKSSFTSLKADMRLTSDGKIILCHDDGFTLNSSGNIISYDSSNKTLIHDLTYAECMALEYSNGNSVCDLDYFICLCKQTGKTAYITIRNEYQEATISAYMEILEKYEMVGNTIVNNYSASFATCSAVRAANNNIAICFTFNLAELAYSGIVKAAALGNCIVCVNGVTTTASVLNDYVGLINFAKSLGLRFYAAIVSEDIIGDLLEYGVTGAQISKMLPRFGINSKYRHVTVSAASDVNIGKPTLNSLTLISVSSVGQHLVSAITGGTTYDQCHAFDVVRNGSAFNVTLNNNHEIILHNGSSTAKYTFTILTQI